MRRRISLYLAVFLVCLGSSACRKSEEQNSEFDKIEPMTDPNVEPVTEPMLEPITEPMTDRTEQAEEPPFQSEISNYNNKENKIETMQIEQGGEEVTVDTFQNNNLKLSELLIAGSDMITIREKLNKHPSGTALDLTDIKGAEIRDLFYSMIIDEGIKERIVGKSYKKDCDIPFSDLRYVRVLYYGFDGKTHIGELIVATSIAEDIIEIFQELYEISYPIERMVLVDEYNADDNLSMEANNSSAFNYRKVEGSDRISLHSYGLAVDINPLYNPYVHKLNGKTVITPVGGEKYADRSLDCEYYIRSEDPCYQAFIKRGFTWGGDWKTLKDYQHFQKESLVEHPKEN